MADSFKDKIGQARDKVSEAAKATGHKISETAEKVGDWVKEKVHQAGHRADEAAQKAEHAVRETCGTSRTTADIQEHMEVIGSDGNKVGTVDHVEGTLIKLTRGDSPDGRHHFVPLDWVARVDTHVHLSKDSAAAREEWQSASA